MTIFDARREAGLERALEGDGWVAASHAAVQTVLRLLFMDASTVASPPRAGEDARELWKRLWQSSIMPSVVLTRPISRAP